MTSGNILFILYFFVFIIFFQFFYKLMRLKTKNIFGKVSGILFITGSSLFPIVFFHYVLVPFILGFIYIFQTCFVNRS